MLVRCKYPVIVVQLHGCTGLHQSCLVFQPVVTRGYKYYQDKYLLAMRSSILNITLTRPPQHLSSFLLSVEPLQQQHA